jgi:hypothetical protein
VAVYGKVDPTLVSVSGLSSGAFFAVQYQIAYSASIRGAAIYAGGPYYCAQGSLVDALLMCTESLETIPLSTLESYISQQVQAGSIDGIGNLTSQHVFLFSGILDTTVNPAVMKVLEKMYRDLGVMDIKSNYDLLAAHTYPTLNFGNPCTLSYVPYISQCDYDGAGTGLQTIYGPLKPAVSPISSNIMEIRQDNFTNNPAAISLAATGYAYVPSACRLSSSTVCKLHVAFHGCLQNAGTVNEAFVENAGYNGWAEANNIIVLYPQTTVSFVDPVNEGACWDWWGYTRSDYAMKSGPQMVFTNNLINYFIQNY